MMEHPSQVTGMLRTAVTGARHRGPWLLLIDGDMALQLPVRFGSHSILVTVDVPAFHATLGQEQPGIVVCSEPPADSRTLNLVLAERSRRPQLRAVHMAPPGAVSARLAALRAGFDDSLPTTTPIDELLGRLEWLSATGRPRRRAAHLVKVGPGLVLDLAAHELRHGAEAVHLRPKEYGLLAVLAAHPGRVYSRRELLDLVWSPNHASDTRTVDVHVRWLRSRLESAAGGPVRLVTVRGAGYRLDVPDR